MPDAVLWGHNVFEGCMVLQITDFLSYVKLETSVFTPKYLHAVDLWFSFMPILNTPMLSFKLCKK